MIVVTGVMYAKRSFSISHSLRNDPDITEVVDRYVMSQLDNRGRKSLDGNHPAGRTVACNEQTVIANISAYINEHPPRSLLHPDQDELGELRLPYPEPVQVALNQVASAAADLEVLVGDRERLSALVAEIPSPGAQAPGWRMANKHTGQGDQMNKRSCSELHQRRSR